MPPKKTTGKRAVKKGVASLADAEVLNNGEREVAEKLATDAKNLPNGSSFKDAGDFGESPKLKVTKRSTARVHNGSPGLETETLTKNPVAKGRGKKKSNENKVIENKIDTTQRENPEINEVKANDDIEPKPKGRGGGKKVEIKTKKVHKNKKELLIADSVQKEESIQVEQIKLPENNTKGASNTRKKQAGLSKSQEEIEIKQEIEEGPAVGKSSKKYSKSLEKTEEIIVKTEPEKKKGKTSKKEKIDQVEVTAAEEGKSDVKDKKPTKRARGVVKSVTVIEETADVLNGDVEDVLPKKRSRNSPTVGKDVVQQKPKRGRSKKSEKEDNKIIEEEEMLPEKVETKKGANGQPKHEKSKEKEELISSNKKETAQKEPMAPAPKRAAAKDGRKRAAPSTTNKKTSITTATNGENLDDGVGYTELEDEADSSKPSKKKKGKSDARLQNATETKYDKTDFELAPPSDGLPVEEPRFNFKISSWNVAGLRSWLQKDGLKFLDYEQPDIFCMQETKCTNEQLPEDVVPIPGYHPYWLCMPGGYAGVAIYSKIMPINVEYGIGNKEFDSCGRIITAEYEKFFLINVYVPNSGRKLVNLEGRMKWEKLFQQFVQDLDARKPVLICGDMNVSHQEHDLANPKANSRSAGFTKEERDKMTELLALGYIDTFRHLYPDHKGAYTYWTYMAKARSRNVGWRLDYFIVSERLIKRVVDNCIRSQCMGSDHCPITLFLKL